jgi:hypothetical protein
VFRNDIEAGMDFGAKSKALAAKISLSYFGSSRTAFDEGRELSRSFTRSVNRLYVHAQKRRRRRHLHLPIRHLSDRRDSCYFTVD